MNKGMTTQTVVSIVLGIVVIVVSLLLANYIPNLVKDFKTAMCNWGVQSACMTVSIEDSDISLINAIKCAHYRCSDSDGCKSNNIKKLSWESNGVVYNCTDFCDDDWRDSNDKICAINAEQYPIEVHIDDEVILEIETEETQDFNSLWDENSNFDEYALGVDTCLTKNKILSFDDSLSLEVGDRIETSSSCFKYKNTPERVRISGDQDLYISTFFHNDVSYPILTSPDGSPLILPFFYSTHISNDRSYKILEGSGVSEELTLKYSKNYPSPSPRYRIITKNSDHEAIDETYITLTDSQDITEDSEFVSIKMKCDSFFVDEKIICSSGTLLCGTHLVKLLSVDEFSDPIAGLLNKFYNVNIEIQYIDPQCHSRGVLDDSPGCEICKDGPDPIMWCYKYEECEDTGFCEDFEKSDLNQDCYRSPLDNCPDNCELCEKDDSSFSMCCDETDTCDTSTGYCGTFEIIIEDEVFDFDIEGANPKSILIRRSSDSPYEPTSYVTLEGFSINQINYDSSSPDTLLFDIFIDGALMERTPFKTGELKTLTSDLYLRLNSFTAPSSGTIFEDISLTVSYPSNKCFGRCYISTFDDFTC